MLWDGVGETACAWFKHTASRAACPRPISDNFSACWPVWPCLQSYAAQLGEDPIVHAHLSALYDTLLEQNLIRCGVRLPVAG